MENFEKYFNEDFELEETYDFKDLQAKKEFNLIWKSKFNELLAGKKVWYTYKDKHGLSSISKSGATVEKVYIGANTGNLFVKTNRFKPFLLTEFHVAGYKKPHFEAENDFETDNVLKLIAEYNTAFHNAALESNGVARSENRAEEKLDDQINTGKELNINKTEDLVAWVKANIKDILFRLPSTENASDAPKSLIARLNKTAAELEHRYPGITASRHFEWYAKNAEPVKSWYSYWGITGLTTFKVPFEEFPTELQQMVIEAKRKSIARDEANHKVKSSNDNAKLTDLTINNIYFAFAILDLLDNDYTILDIQTPAEIANSEDVFKQDFDSVNAYGEKVESLKEGKEDKYTCCICGEECTGYGNNPEPFKHEGRCCDACNLKFVIPARIAVLKPEEE